MVQRAGSGWSASLTVIYALGGVMRRDRYLLGRDSVLALVIIGSGIAGLFIFPR
jgi:hypothetical protein